MNYVIAVLPDQTQAEAARTALAQENLPAENINIVGKGFKHLDDYEFLDPKQKSRRQAFRMSYWLIPFGFLSGYAFNVQTGYELISWAGVTGNHIIGGLLGAIGGAMGSFFIGGGFLNFGSDTNNAPSYSDRLKEGKYVVVVSGPPNLTNKATRILRQYQPDHLQTLVSPSQV
ncbi:hypothetical protein IQ268_18575 [Oculatella sp. LEGE 06141]|uniref:hypothetical protein n=1 Tax=Oculatella sp. LEGE 06141 TaxID=1828648 RepID=UPI00187E58BF|nr:hypothetical protein [Oculatella sp. LEGE 06141]MBE9180570.1 hypothetical protein [Oculatella sp. LEGE 06141]